MGLGVVGDLIEAGGDLVEEGAETGGDVIEDTSDVLGDAAAGLADAMDDAFDAIEDALDAFGDVLAELGIDLTAIEDAWDSFEEFAGDDWDRVFSGVEAAWETLSRGIDEAWASLCDVLEEAQWELSGFLDEAYDEIGKAADAAWDPIEAASEKAWEAAAAVAEGIGGTLADMVELSVEIMDRIVEFLVDVTMAAITLITQLGACIGGILVLKHVKADNVVENFWKVPRPLPAGFRADIERIFGNRSFWNVWYIDDARLSPDWYSNTTEAMAMSGVTLAGATLTHLIFVTHPWDVQHVDDRQTMAHELVHVVQYRRLITDPAFGCAYGVGFADAGFDYRRNEMEDVAFDFVERNAGAI